MKKTTALFVYLFGVVVAFSQSTEPYKYLGNYTQPAPNVASLGKFVDYPVSYYTGTPSISIPIYELQDGAAKASISLSYHASGIRVAELSSWVGLGWALNAGGMITRSVRGGPDDGVFESGTLCGGYYRDSGIRKMPKLPYAVGGVITETSIESEIRKVFHEQLSAGNADTEPDLFTFNFPGGSGKFVFDENKTPRLLTHQDVRIEVVYNNLFESWLITTPDGTKYYFGENNVREVNTVYSTSGPDNNSLKPASWLLTKVVYPNTKDTLHYDYQSESYSYFDLGQETKIYSGAPNLGNSILTACQAGIARPMNVYKTTVAGFRLKQIRSRNYRITFGVNTSNFRQDLVNTGPAYAYMLDSIKIYNALSQCIKQFVLTHQYFNSTNATQATSAIFSFTNSDASDTKRLKLTSVKEYSGDGVTSKPGYNITYEETLQLPRRLSYDIDHWGYSNYSAGNRNERFTPTVTHPICYYGVTSGGDRTPSWPDMQQFTIKSIQDPLGVVTNFEFEAHTSTLAIPTSTVGGLRIKKITNIDNLTGKSNVRFYSYGAGGVLYKVPRYLEFPDNEFLLNRVIGEVGYTYKGYNGLTLYAAIKQSQSIVPLQDFQGNHIGYSIVRETFGLNGEGGYKEYSFLADQLPLGSSRLDIANYTTNTTLYHPHNGYTYGLLGNGRFNDIPADSLIYYSNYNVDNYYPAAPVQVEFRRGQLLTEHTFDSSAQLLRTVRNNYQQKYRENLLIRGFKIYRIIESVNDPAFGLTSRNHDNLTFYKLITGISQLANTVTIDYKDGKSFTTTTSYQYESNNHFNKTGDSTINSSGDTIVTKTYYSSDYANTATADNVFGKMEKRNMILPVATRVWKNGQLLSGTITLFKDFATSAPDTFINPSKIYALEVNAPMTPIAAGEAVKLNGKFSTLLPNASFKEQAVFNVNPTTGKIIEQRLVTDKNQALIWDNNNSLPLAQTDNAMYSDVAYSSFETAEKGNWTYTGTPTTDATTRTGTKVYPAASGLSKTGITSAKKYILSYWYKGGTPTVTGGTQTNSFTGRLINFWIYRQVTITGTTSITIGGTGSIDEVRLHPEIAQMTTYTYDALFRLIALNSPNNTVSYYEYDAMNRLVAIKDESGNVLKAFEYNYGVSSR